ncbi:CPBP family intramembrane metalloprotease [Massilia sp. IC2-477]|uniref:CPBP family glutamic-type intramembrane protease n=1 Tax=Massilia sp. IC2-477 TaxID=2887198 RepID=UPI001D106197|nr:CPBP family glutamic-type intramembrane protease [Massilia sp. IC2-477]MCC2954422.1 CPBP family intramembrane metalloprotease [Massilia sp. IC2-477]
MANQTTTTPPRLARWHPRIAPRPLLAATCLGACMGLLGTLCALLVLGLALQFLPPELWGDSAAASLAGLGQDRIFVLAILYAPVIETLLGQLLPVELARRLGAPALACVLLSGLVFGCGHLVNGGLVHALTTFFSGMVFACAYLAMRWLGIGPAFLAAGSAHAVQNGTILYLIAPLFPGSA